MSYVAIGAASFVGGFWAAIGVMCWLGRRSQSRVITTANKSREEPRRPHVLVFLPKTDGLN